MNYKKNQIKPKSTKGGKLPKNDLSYKSVQYLNYYPSTNLPLFLPFFNHKGMNDDNSCVPPPPSHDNDFTHERNAPLNNQFFCQIKIWIPNFP